MIRYEYECKDCHETLRDVEQRISDKPKKTCPSCGKNTLERIIYGGMASFMRRDSTVGSVADKNSKRNKSKINEAEQAKKEHKDKHTETSWYDTSKSGGKTSKEIAKMNPNQKEKYIMEGK